MVLWKKKKHTTKSKAKKPIKISNNMNDMEEGELDNCFTENITVSSFLRYTTAKFVNESIIRFGGVSVRPVYVFIHLRVCSFVLSCLLNSNSLF